jgi:hypothetical protein
MAQQRAGGSGWCGHYWPALLSLAC